MKRGESKCCGAAGGRAIYKTVNMVCDALGIQKKRRPSLKPKELREWMVGEVLRRVEHGSTGGMDDVGAASERDVASGAARQRKAILKELGIDAARELAVELKLAKPKKIGKMELKQLRALFDEAEVDPAAMSGEAPADPDAEREEILHNLSLGEMKAVAIAMKLGKANVVNGVSKRPKLAALFEGCDVGELRSAVEELQTVTPKPPKPGKSGRKTNAHPVLTPNNGKRPRALRRRPDWESA